MRTSPATLERKADALLRAHKTSDERKAQDLRIKQADKRERRYQKSLARNQWAVVK